MDKHEIYKFPRTQHIEGSCLQLGDEDMKDVAFKTVVGQNLVITEKVDGANAAISFLPNGELLLQNRGHYLTGGPREKHFSLFKRWAYTHMTVFRSVLGNRYVMYGEWLYAKHTIFYNNLPHYFLEFDVLDTEADKFLSVYSRQQLLARLPVVSVKILKIGQIETFTELMELIGPSNFIISQTKLDTTMEGLYIKIENNDYVLARYKYVRRTFHDEIAESGTHWLSRPIVLNQLTTTESIL